jgi:hypothetical protein
MALRSESISNPIRSPEDATRLVELLSLLDAMGLLRIDEPIATLDASLLERAAAAAATAGIGRDVQRRVRGAAHTPRAMSAAIRELAEALADSPAPLHEAREMLGVFGPERLAALVGSSQASLRRYASGLRAVPDRVAARLHLLAQIVAELRGAYNETGVRRWFERPRTQLDGREPQQLLSGDWDPDEPNARRVLALARGLRAAGAS